MCLGARCTGRMRARIRFVGRIWTARRSQDIVTGLSAPRGIALDVSGGKIYWTESGSGKIGRSNLDGSQVQDIVTGLGTPRGIALQVSGQTPPPPQGKPDLVVTVSTSTNRVASGETFTLSATVTNQGDAASASTTVKFYLLSEVGDSISGSQGGLSVSGLDAGDSAEVSTNAPVPNVTNETTLYYNACVYAVSNESNTNNNCSTKVQVIVTPSSPGSPDRAVLVALYNATNGAQWKNKTNWLSDKPLNQWYGVETDAAGRVQLLLLRDNQLSGTIPAALGNLTNLQGLNLQRNQLSGTIPVALGNLTNLNYLNLRDNQLSGTIPAALGNLTNLQYLLLDGNQLSGTIPVALGNLTNLQYLQLDGNQLSGTIPVALSNLTNLQTLDLGWNQLSGSIPEALGNLTNLKWLGLLDNQLSGSIPTALGNLTNLQYLQLEKNQLSGTIPAALGNLTNLQYLNLRDNQLSGTIPVALGNLTNLNHLNLRDNQLSGTIPATLGNLTNLTELYLRNNQLTGCIPNGLREILSNDLDSLGLNDCSAAEEPPPDQGAPDLVVSLYAPSGDRTLTLGGSFTLGANITNAGSGSAAATWVRFRRSTDSVIRGNDPQIGSAQQVSNVPVSLSMTVTPTAAGTYYYGACVDAVNNESNTTNNCSQGVKVTVQAAQTQKPDLVVSLYAPSGDRTLTLGGSFTLGANITNAGSGSAAATWVRFRRSTDSVIRGNDPQIGNAQQVSNVPVSLSMTVTPTAAGTYYYGACVDAVNNESNTTNNCSQGVKVTVQAAQTQKPDLVVSLYAPSGDRTLTLGGSFTLGANITNAGSGSAAATWVRFRRSTDSVIRGNDPQVGNAQQVSSVPVSLSMTVTPTAAGTYYYGACVDAVNNESNTTNNCSQGVKVTVQAAQKPDLQVTASVNKTKVPAGQSFTLSASVKNIGGGSVGKRTLRYYRSTGSFNNKREFDTDEVDIPSNNLQKRISPNNNDAYPPVEGDQAYYVVCVDAVNNESNTTNNCASTERVTVQRPNIKTDISVTSEDVIAGEYFDLRVTVSNIGTRIANNVTLYGYINDSRVFLPVLGNSLPIGNVNPRGLWKRDISLRNNNKGTFIYKVCAKKVSYEKETSDNCDQQRIEVIEVNESPRAPTVQVRRSSSGKHRVSWNSVLGATKYKIYWSADDDWSRTEESTPVYTAFGQSWDSNRNSFSKDYYKVKACNNKDICSDFSEVLIFDRKPSSPPEKLIYTDTGDGLLTWTQSNSRSVTHFQIYNSKENTNNWIPVGESEDSYWQITGRDSSVDNHYKVRACNMSKCSEYSKPEKIEGSRKDPPEKPTISKSYYKKNSNTKRIEWTQPNGGTPVEYYEVWRDKGVWWTSEKYKDNVPGTARAWEDDKPTAGNDLYKIRACNRNSSPKCSEFSNEVTIKK